MCRWRHRLRRPCRRKSAEAAEAHRDQAGCYPHAGGNLRACGGTARRDQRAGDDAGRRAIAAGTAPPPVGNVHWSRHTSRASAPPWNPKSAIPVRRMRASSSRRNCQLVVRFDRSGNLHRRGSPNRPAAFLDRARARSRNRANYPPSRPKIAGRNGASLPDRTQLSAVKLSTVS